MMGSGKTSTGPILSKNLGYSFVDIDSLIEELAGMSINEIFQKDGELAFRKIESQVLHVVGQRHSLVVATGGGLITSPENWGVLHQGIVVWLDVALNNILLRLKGKTQQRPLINNSESMEVEITRLIEERYKYYVEADMQLKISDETSEEVAELILEKLPSILNFDDQFGQQTTVL
tara:strand:+ start:33794 stop:34321 length:528 start_codon:yes stop_codon:yes gene_type:complete